MNAITMGNPNLFVKGMVEVIVTDPETGNIIGYDNVASESAVNTSVNMGEITGGFGNPLLINIPDTTRISGSLTSQAFSLQQRALMTGGSVTQTGVVSYCETITATGTTLTVTKNPVKAYGQNESDTNGWCYVREHGAATYPGTNYEIDLTTKNVVNFTATSGTQYDVFYFVDLLGSQVLALQSSFNPAVATIRLKYGVYSKTNNSVSHGTLVGYLYFVVPRAQFTGDAGIGANQTSNSTTSYDWVALMPDNNMMDCSNCGANSQDYAYYIYAPCGDQSGNVKSFITLGPVFVEQGQTVDLRKYVYALMKNGDVVPVKSSMNLSFHGVSGGGNYTVVDGLGDTGTPFAGQIGNLGNAPQRYLFTALGSDQLNDDYAQEAYGTVIVNNNTDAEGSITIVVPITARN